MIGPSIVAVVYFLPSSEGGRPAVPSAASGDYMPHLVTVGGDPTGVTGNIDYLGVRFVAGDPLDGTGRYGRFRMQLLYYATIDYSALQPGVEFHVCEGGRVIAHGVVVERIEHGAAASDDSTNADA